VYNRDVKYVAFTHLFRSEHFNENVDFNLIVIIYYDNFLLLTAEVARLKMENRSTPANLYEEWNNDSEVSNIFHCGHWHSLSPSGAT
jgi:hypothetical protein